MKHMQTTIAILAISSVTLLSATVHAESVNNRNLQQAAKRPYVAATNDSDAQVSVAGQAWEGTTLQTALKSDAHAFDQKGALREQLNLQFPSKRPYLQPEGNE